MTDFLLKIDGEIVPNISKYTISYNKLWADAERNMNGDIRATFIGIFPKVELEIGGILTAQKYNYFAAYLTDHTSQLALLIRQPIRHFRHNTMPQTSQ